MTQRLVPEVAVSDLGAARTVLSSAPGATFADGAGGLRCAIGDQDVLLRPGAPASGPLHHIAFAVPDPAAALAQGALFGGALDTAMTPDGVAEIPEFWEAGVRYVFLRGPDDVRLELCAGRRAPPEDGIGHDHIGILCADLAAMRAFFLGLGLREIAAHMLHRPEGDTPVAFLAHGAQVVEVFQPPGSAGLAASQTRITALHLEGAGRAEALTGPEGLRVVLSA